MLDSLKSLKMPKLRQRDITLVLIVLSLLIAVAWYFYMFTPTRDRISELDNRIESLAAEVRQGEIAKANLPQLEESLAQAKQARDDFLAELPLESEVAALLDSFSEEASTYNISLSSINQTGSRSQAIPDVRSLGFSLASTGSFASTLGFLGSLESLKRFTKVESVNFSVNNDGTTDNPDLSTTYSLSVFVYTGSTGIDE